jgi:poly-gamma-glutamate synthesis protein (capsule biosynthesis protein)
MKRALATLAALLLLVGVANAETKLYTFAYNNPPAALTDTAMSVGEGTAEITLTFAGDCTLGGEHAGRRRFNGYIAKNGFAYPFSALKALFSGDDLSMVNLEGVLSDSRDGKVAKQYNFIGSPEYAAILTQGSVECVTLANNHALDYGDVGKQDTIAALTQQGVAYCDDPYVTVLDKDGVRVGFTASSLQLNQKAFLRQVQALRAVGCAAIVHNMHMGEEYADTLTPAQEKAAKFLTDNGAALVIGHHPHVAQGLALYGKAYVAFSLGNCVFGGNSDPDDYDACLLQATLRFENGALSSEQVTLWPIRVSTAKNSNDYQPQLLEGADAQRVLAKMQATSAFPLKPFIDGEGAAQNEVNWR